MGVAIGFWAAILMTTDAVDVDYACLRGKVEVLSAIDGRVSIVGESLICGRDWKVSNIYGPTIEDWDKPVEFDDLKLPSSGLDKSR